MSETAQTTWTWERLCEAEPGLRCFAVSAEQAGVNGCGWWLTWVKGFGDFQKLFSHTARVEELRGRYDLERIALDHLEAVYTEARGGVSVARRPSKRIDVAPARWLQQAPRVPPAQYRPSRKAKW